MTATAQPDTDGRSHGKLRRPLVVAGAVVAVLAVAITALAVLGRSHDLSRPPYADAASTGLLTLCGKDGKPVTRGSVEAAAPIWRAVGATAVTTTRNSSATLYAYQPRNGVPAAQWGGEMITAPSSFTNARHPMAQATNADIALKDFLAAYPTSWKGTVQLRLYVGSAAAGVQTRHYDTADLAVSGSTWKVLKAGNGSCTDGSATSLETLTGVAGAS